MSVAEDVQSLESRYILQLYRRTPIVLTEGRGVVLRDQDGREYLDFISGIGVTSLGHGHPALVAAIADQAQTLLHTSNLYFHPLQGQVAERLAALSGLPRTFFCNSGAEAVEACVKFARRYWFSQGTPRPGFVALAHSFHGRTCGAVSLTWNEHYRQPFEPLLPGVTFVDPDDPDALLAAVSESTAAVIVEAIQGEGGVRPLSPAFARAVGDACRRTGALLMADEVQCGLGRTGHPFAYATLGLEPDLVAVGKALGGGVPVGAALASEAVGGALTYGDHGSTYGGNLLACRAALVFLQELVDGGLLAHVGRVGARLTAALDALAARRPSVVTRRGAGLMQGLELRTDAAPVVEAALRRGLLVNRTAQTVVRLLPPLTIADADIDRGVALLEEAIADVEKERTA
ncbi:MAG: acetylornithine/succinylornithine family transaminase [Acidobacteriota bacterium]|nr:acetylornithine/succinylornithine family transaminase [Acidobacteriota bacterium]